MTAPQAAMPPAMKLPSVVDMLATFFFWRVTGIVWKFIWGLGSPSNTAFALTLEVQEGLRRGRKEGRFQKRMLNPFLRSATARLGLVLVASMRWWLVYPNCASQLRTTEQT